MINIFINDDNITFEYSKNEGLIKGELKTPIGSFQIL